MNTIAIGTEVNDRYQIRAHLGSGGMATVYLAFDKQREEEVALKFLSSDQAGSPKGKNRFIKEFSLLSQLDHPHIVEVYDLQETESGAPFFSMEVLKTSGPKLGTEKLIEDQLFPILEQVADALAYLHTQKILYCDLKPSNIVVSSSSASPTITLIDFGIARLVDEESTAHMTGTSHYMSPEQIRNEKLDVRSDIYSFGILAFELCTGKVPYDDKALFTITASHLIAKIPSARSSNSMISASLDRLIKVCMEKDKSDRYGSMPEVIKRLKRARTQPSFVTQMLKKIF